MFGEDTEQNISQIKLRSCLMKTLQTLLIILVLGIGQVTWSHAAEVKITASDAAADDQFASSVSISGDYAIVGAVVDDHSGQTDAGSAYIFKRDGANWTQQAKLIASDAAASDYFGRSVSISGDYAIVGAQFHDNGLSNSGAAYIFYRNEGGSDNWGQQAELTASDATAGDEFGMGVSISGDYVIVGAWFDGGQLGSAYIFKRNGTNWTQQAKLTASDGMSGDRFGYPVSISGDYAVVGAGNDDHAGGTNAGSAYIFYRNEGGSDNWGQQVKLTASDAAGNDIFGNAVSISGDYAVIGAYHDEHSGLTNAGSAYTFYRNEGGTDNWGQQAKLTAGDAAAEDKFGSVASISGDYVIVGAASADHSGETDAGAAYSFLRSGSAWSQQAKLTASDAAAVDAFGDSVAINGDYAIVGARMDDHSGITDAGSAYIYHSINDLSLPVELSLFTATTSSDNVILTWRTETEVDNAGFSIYRSERTAGEDASSSGNYTEIAFVEGARNAGMPTDYQFTDKKAEPGKTYFYYLEDIDIAGEKNKSGIIKVVLPPAKFVGAIPSKFALLQNFPNPFNPETWLPYQLAESAPVSIRIFDPKGRIVRTVYFGEQQAGSYRTKDKAAYWDGKNDYGERVSSGVFFYQLKAGKFSAVRKMIIIK